MIGFVMMIGVIVNHSILLVAAIRGAEGPAIALEEAIRLGLNQRLRAILASTLTGALGALPMAINPGPGSVIYRGLAGGQYRRCHRQPCLQPAPDSGADSLVRRAAGRDQSDRRGGDIVMSTPCLTKSLLLLVAGLGSSVALAQGGAKAPPVVVEIATARAARVAPRAWIPGSIVSRDDARVAGIVAGRVQWIARSGNASTQAVCWRASTTPWSNFVRPNCGRRSRVPAHKPNSRARSSIVMRILRPPRFIRQTSSRGTRAAGHGAA